MPTDSFRLPYHLKKKITGVTADLRDHWREGKQQLEVAQSLLENN